MWAPVPDENGTGNQTYCAIGVPEEDETTATFKLFIYFIDHAQEFLQSALMTRNLCSNVYFLKE